MRVVYTDDALRDIDDILNWLAGNYPGVAPVVALRIEQVVARIAVWPRSARLVPTHPAFTQCRWAATPM